MDMRIDMSSINRLAANYRGAEPIVRDETRKGVTRAVIQIEADAKRLVPTDTHTLQRSLTHEVTATGRDVRGRAGTNSQYGRIVEEGRRPGKMPPSGVLLGWMGRHGIDARAEFLIRRAIGRRGTKGKPYLKPAFDKNRAAITRELGVAVPRRILQRIGTGR